MPNKYFQDNRVNNVVYFYQTKHCICFQGGLHKLWHLSTIYVSFNFLKQKHSEAKILLFGDALLKLMARNKGKNNYYEEICCRLGFRRNK